MSMKLKTKKQQNKDITLNDLADFQLDLAKPGKTYGAEKNEFEKMKRRAKWLTELFLPYFNFKKGDSMEKEEYKRIDLQKLTFNPKPVSSGKALRNVIPIQWTDDVLQGRKKVIIEKIISLQ